MISVIIPIYNVSKFIDRGLGYVLAQDYQEFEVILVDDGSTDGSGELCDMWGKKDSRIRVFHKSNAGAGSARNVGIENAKGKFIYFFDIDDCIPNSLLSELVVQMTAFDTEMMIFGYRNIDKVYNVVSKVAFDQLLVESNERMKEVFFDNCVIRVNGFPWNKMYRKSFLDKFNLRFENQRIQQDEVFNLRCYRCVNRLLFSNRVLYDYFVYDKGNTRSYFIPDRFDIYKSVYNAFRCLQKEWNLNDNRFEDYLYRRLFAGVNATLRFNLMHPDCNWSKVHKKQEIERVMKDEDVREAVSYVEKKGLGIEDKLFLKAYHHSSILFATSLNYIFSTMRFVKHFFVNLHC